MQFILFNLFFTQNVAQVPILLFNILFIFFNEKIKVHLIYFFNDIYI
jgi:hypothetical protein